MKSFKNPDISALFIDPYISSGHATSGSVILACPCPSSPGIKSNPSWCCSRPVSVCRESANACAVLTNAVQISYRRVDPRERPLMSSSELTVSWRRTRSSGLAVVMAWVNTMTKGVKDGYRRILQLSVNQDLGFGLEIYRPVDVFGLLVDFPVSKIRKTLEMTL